MRALLTVVLVVVSAIFGAGAFAGAGFSIVGQALIRWWSGRASDKAGDEWTRAVIRAVLAGRTPQAQAELLQATYQEILQQPEPAPEPERSDRFN
jgi:hypothetical protein